MIKRKIGQPIKLFKNKKNRKRFLDAIKIGRSIKDASGLAGITDATFYSYQRKAGDALGSGRTPTRTEKKYIKFIQDYHDAADDLTKGAIKCVKTEALKNPEFALKFLKQTMPEVYDEKKVPLIDNSQHNNTVAIGDTSDMSDEEKKKIIDANAKRLKFIQEVEDEEIVSVQELKKENPEEEEKK